MQGKSRKTSAIFLFFCSKSCCPHFNPFRELWSNSGTLSRLNIPNKPPPIFQWLYKAVTIGHARGGQPKPIYGSLLEVLLKILNFGPFYDKNEEKHKNLGKSMSFDPSLGCKGIFLVREMATSTLCWAILKTSSKRSPKKSNSFTHN
jgi:hypothetical protein